MTVALCMIVKDEALVIERCIASVRPHIDTWVICDTGSTDGTPELIEQAMGGIPGTLHRRPWVSFGHNRSELMERARGQADHLLLLDADWTLHVEGALPPSTSDCHLIRFQGDLEFALPALIRGDIEWRYEGAAHEFLTADIPFSRDRLPGASFVNHSDGHDSGHRIERNRALLEQDLARDPDDPRTLFYLGLTYQDLGHPERAIELLLRRAGMGGWDEEVFYATYRAGSLQAGIDWELGVATLLRAWQSRPTRAEPLVELAKGYRRRSQHHLAELFATKAAALAVPDDLLFVHRPPYEWGAAFELAVATWWTGDHDLSLATNEALLDGRPLPMDIEQHTRRNRQMELERRASRPLDPGFPTVTATSLPLLSDLAGSTRLRQLVLDRPGEEDAELGIEADTGGYRLVAAVGGRRLLLRLDDDLDVQSQVDLPAATWRRPRLVAVEGGWAVVADAQDAQSGSTWPVLVDVTDGRVMDLRSPRPDAQERGWAPLVAQGGMRLIRSLDPLVVLMVDLADGASRVLVDELGPTEASSWRGAGSAVAWHDGGHLMVVREAREDGSQQHRFVALDARSRPISASEAFQIVRPASERGTDLCHRGPALVLSLSSRGPETWLARLDADEVRAMLRPI